MQAFLGHENITTTSRYLQGAPVRLEQALTRMEAAAGFAQDSHKHDSDASSKAPKPAVENLPNSLNLKLVRKERFELSRPCERQPLKLVENLL